MTGEPNGDLHSYISGLMLRCDDATDGKLTEAQQQELLDQASAFSGIPVMGRQVSFAIQSRNFAHLKGALGACHALDAGSGNVIMNQTQNNSQNVNVDVSFSQVISNVMNLPDDELDAMQKTEIARMLAELDNASGSLKKTKALDVIRWLGDKGFEVVKVIAPTLLQAILGMG